jgi:hypothetical protein
MYRIVSKFLGSSDRIFTQDKATTSLKLRLGTVGNKAGNSTCMVNTLQVNSACRILEPYVRYSTIADKDYVCGVHFVL